MGTRSVTVNEGYKGLLLEIYHRGVWETNERTGVQIKAATMPISFSIDLSNNMLPVAGNRRYYPHIAAAELAWMIQGTQDPKLILKHAPKLWSKFIEDGILKTAYGWRWSEAFGRNQLEEAIFALQKDSTNRQCYVQAWDPRTDGNGRYGPKNIPCPIGFSINIINDKVNMALAIRSSDVFVGLPYDIMVYALLLDAIASTLRRTPGVLHISLAHAHVYKPQYQMLEDSICVEADGQKWISPHVLLPCLRVDTIYNDPEFYIAHLKALASRSEKHPWDPKPDVVE